MLSNRTFIFIPLTILFCFLFSGHVLAQSSSFNEGKKDSTTINTNRLPEDTITVISDTSKVSSDSINTEQKKVIVLPEDSSVLKTPIDSVQPPQSTNSVQSASTADSSMLETVDSLNTEITKEIIDSIPKRNKIKSDSTVHRTSDKIITPTNKKYKTIDPEAEVHFKLRVVDSTTQKPLPALVQFTIRNNSGQNSVSKARCNNSGLFVLKLTRDTKFEIEIVYDDYEPLYDTINFMHEKVDTNNFIAKVYKLHKLRVGDIIPLENIHFKQGDYHLQKQAYPTLNKLIDLMKENPDMQIKLKGHTDNTGTHDMLVDLSRKRVYEVRGYMVQNGITSRRIKAEGYGYSQPVVSGTDPESQAKNRRVEFEILKL